jgi:hypothetical protein
LGCADRAIWTARVLSGECEFTSLDARAKQIRLRKVGFFD